MAVDGWITLAVLIVMFVALVRDRWPPHVVLASGVLVLLLAGVISSEQALSGLSSEATVTIAALYVLAGAAGATGALTGLITWVLSGRRPRTRLVVAAASVSSVVPNTPLVALGAPRVVEWARRTGRPASDFLMPMSYACILGGVVTVLGTSTNLVISDLLASTGAEPLEVFEVTPVGLPVAAAGALLLVLAGPRLLPERTPATDALRTSVREFQMAMLVVPDGPLVSRSVADAGLRHLQGVFLAAVERDGLVEPADPQTILQPSDVCLFVGDLRQILDLQAIPGLAPAEEVSVDGPGHRLYEAVLSEHSELVGTTLRATGFRARYGGTVLAIHRPGGAPLTAKLGTAPLHRGDVLLILADPDFDRRWRESHDFSLVASSDEPPPVFTGRAWLVTAAALGMVVLAATGVLDLVEAALAALAVVLVGGAITVGGARRAVDLGVVAVIAASISLGSAISSSGLSGELADLLVSVSGSLGWTAQIALLIVATQALTELLSNSAAAALMLPIALDVGAQQGLDERAVAIAVLIGASCSFLTPIGYQTNTMVYGLGGYRFTDFTRVGLPLTLLTTAVATAALWVGYGR